MLLNGDYQRKPIAHSRRHTQWAFWGWTTRVAGGRRWAVAANNWFAVYSLRAMSLFLMGCVVEVSIVPQQSTAVDNTRQKIRGIKG